ncbi:MAG: XTP/dITP diphosphatase [Methanobacteriota archaeon]
MIRFVTTNEGKYREVFDRLLERGIRIERLDRGYPEIQADSLEKIVRFGATVLDDEVRGDYLIDDSGLFVDALYGFPGPYSSYVYKRLGTAGILTLLAGRTDRGASFETAFLLRHGGEHATFRGEVRGTISDRGRGTAGFGFDPIFVPAGQTRTFAEMSLHEKNLSSHRARAVDALVAFLEGARKEG